MNYHAKKIIDERFPIEKVGEIKYRQLLFIAAMEDSNFLTNRTNFSAYEKYVWMCHSSKMEPLFTQISFSQFVIRYLNYGIKNKKYQGKKYRIFHKKYKMSSR